MLTTIYAYFDYLFEEASLPVRWRWQGAPVSCVPLHCSFLRLHFPVVLFVDQDPYRSCFESLWIRDGQGIARPELAHHLDGRPPVPAGTEAVVLDDERGRTPDGLFLVLVSRKYPRGELVGCRDELLVTLLCSASFQSPVFLAIDDCM